MANFEAILLDVWQEACRHIEIRESAGAIASLLGRQMPIDAVLVRELDLKRSTVETVAIAPPERSDLASVTRTDCAPDRMKRLIAWCARRDVWHRAGARRGEPAAALPRGIDADVLAVPLASSSSPGVLVLVAPPGLTFEAHHVEMARALHEPLSVALQNDHRLRELTALREAAEADKQSLLARLGRRRLEDTIIGMDAGLRALMERVELVSRSDVPVLILGETGTGKEVIARAIHSGSRRSAGPFIRVNCGAIPSELVDSQLFGHERGGFTGAIDTRKGWFERADGGTLFLDEIGELPLAAQVRLLRILQDGQLERVGGHDHVKVDVRIVAATHRDLAVMVREGRFRDDLWYRIAVFPLQLPPLRERTEDIPAMARHFAERAATRFGLPLQLPTPRDVAALVGYPWPGNVRELAAVIDRAAILGNGERLEIAKALGVTPSASPAPPSAARTGDGGAGSPPAVAPLDEAVRRHIEAALAAAGGRIEGPQGAARMLRVNPHTLRARMRKLGVDWSRFRS